MPPREALDASSLDPVVRPVASTPLAEWASRLARRFARQDLPVTTLRCGETSDNAWTRGIGSALVHSSVSKGKALQCCPAAPPSGQSSFLHLLPPRCGRAGPVGEHCGVMV
jgi:hypothetical protein